MTKIKLTFISALLCAAASSHAGLLNISTNSLQSRTTTASGCTIIENSGPTFQGAKLLVVFTESSEENSDPTLVVQDLNGINVWSNDDWLGARYLNGSLRGGDAASVRSVYLSGVGRTPGRLTDAAILVAFPPGEAVCAFSKERATDNLKRVSISITDITPIVIRSTAEADGGILGTLLGEK